MFRKKTEPLELIDLLPRSETIEIDNKQKVTIFGLSAEDIVALFIRFPPLQGVMVGRGIAPLALLELGPSVVAALCAAAMKKLGDKKSEDAASKLTIEMQLDILEALGRCTFSKGFGPFAQRLRVIAGALSAEVGRALDTKLLKPSKP